MFNITEKITERLCQLQIVKDEDKELYAYGFWQGAILIINLITVLIIGLLFEMLWQTMVFTVAYMMLRMVAGGYHASSQRNCYFLSIILFISALCMIRWVTWSLYLCLIITVLSSITIFFLAPVEDRNKPLDDLELQVYKKRSRIVLCLLLFLALTFLISGKLTILSCITVSFFASAIMLIVGKTKILASSVDTS